MVNELFFLLIENMKEEAVCYRRLALLARDQKELLMAGNVSVLPENIRLQEKQVFVLTPILGHRGETLVKLAKILGVKKLDLIGAANKVPTEMVEEFNEAFGELVQSAKELASIKSTSAKLLNNAMKFSEFTLKTIRGSVKKKSFSVSAAVGDKQPSLVNRIV